MSSITRDNEPDYRCRICLSGSKPNLDFEKNLQSHADVTVLKAIETVMNSKVLQSEDTPNKICCMCLDILEISYNLKNTFEETELKLLEKPSKLSEGLYGSQSELSKRHIVENTSGIKYKNTINEMVMLKTTPQAQDSDLISYLELSEKRSVEDEPSCSTEHSSEPNMTSPNKAEMYETSIIHVAYKKCKYCYYKTDDLSNLKRHITMKHPQTVHNCKFCEYSARTAAHVKRHTEKFHLNEIQFCEFCNFTAETLDDMEKHIDEVHQTKV